MKELAKGIVDVPVVCGHELSGSLGFSERATTCIMNARLIPVIDELIVSVERVLGEKGIRAPLMMFRGDGSMMGSDVARERPVETILSGPAASLMGAVHMAGLRDAVVMDMGGTTTDIGVLRDGRPHLEPEGAVIGGMRTRVRAAQIATSGIGGDSRIAVSQASIVLTPLRVMPLCVAATMWPNVRSYLAAIRDFPPRRAVKKLNVANTAYRIEFFRTLRMPGDPGSVSGADMELLELLSKGPKNLPSAAMALGRGENEFDIPGLESKGLLQRIGLTPTDVLDAKGTFDRFDRDAAMAGVEYMAGMCGLTPEAFVEDACEMIREKLAFELVKVLLSDGTGEVDLGESGMDLVMRSISGTPGSVYRGRILLDRPIVGIGAPSGVYIRWMGEVFGTEVIVNEDADVGNAIGAVTASVAETVEVTIRPMVKFKGDRRVEAFSRMGRFLYGDMDEALEAQTAMAERFAAEAVERSHAEDVAVTSEHDRHKYLTVPGMRDLEEIVLRVTAAGKPRQFR